MLSQVKLHQLHYNPQEHLLSMPRNTLIVMCGPSGSGKTTFAQTHFPLSSVVSTDNCRALISDNARNMECSEEAFDLAYTIVHKRLKLGRTTIFDSTALAAGFRQKMLNIAHTYDFTTLLLVLQTPFQTCYRRDLERLWPSPVGKEVLTSQFSSFEETLQQIGTEGFDLVLTLDSNEVNKVLVRVT